jgi:hypothetical protein
MSEFVGYVGPPSIHDAVIDRVDLASDRLIVVVRTAAPESAQLQIELLEPSEVEQDRPVGMMLFALAELQADDRGRRRFSFVNWDEDDTARLDLRATEVRWSEPTD